jgi:thiol-disulfide isomerase/thioredoxin
MSALHRIALSTVSVTVLLAHAAIADDPAPTAAQLVQAVIDGENQIHGVNSLYLRFKEVGTISARKLEKLAADHRKRTGGNEPPPDLFLANRTGELEFVFDDSRVREVWSNRDRTTRIWNGRQFRMLQEFGSGSLRGTIRDQLPDFDFLSGHLSFGRVGRHDFWFSKSTITPEALGRPEGYRAAGTEQIEGVECHVLENATAKRRLYVAKHDGRARRLCYLQWPRGKDYLSAAAKAAKREFHDSDEFSQWWESLSDAERMEIDLPFQEAMFARSQPWVIFDLDEYREIAPGFWFPARQRATQFESDADGAHFLSGTREQQLVESRVNQKLDDALFELEFPDGTVIVDASYKPPMVYKQDSKRSPAEWNEILKEYRDFATETGERETARNALIGTPCPEFPAGRWLNSEPLTLASLREKVVVLEFWATSCAPCWGTVQYVQEMHSAYEMHAGGGPVRVIGIHDSGSSSEEVTKFMNKAKLTFPVVIDEEVPDQLSGKFFGQLTINSIPECVVVDPEGRIAAFGALHEVGGKIQELVHAQRQK